MHSQRCPSLPRPSTWTLQPPWILRAKLYLALSPSQSLAVCSVLNVPAVLCTVSGTCYCRGHAVTVLVPMADMDQLQRFAARHASQEEAAGAHLGAITFMPLDSDSSFNQLLAGSLKKLNRGSVTRLMQQLQVSMARPCQALMHNATLVEVS